MRRVLLVLGIAGSWLAASGLQWDALTSTQVEMDVQGGSVDEALLQLAERAHANLLFDATQAPGSTCHLRRKGLVMEILRQLCGDYDLGLAQPDKRTFLLWGLPDLEATLQQVQEAKTVESLPTLEPCPDEFELARAVTAYLKERGFSLDTPGAALSVPVSDLPAELKGMVLGYARETLVCGHLPSAKSEKMPEKLDERFWGIAYIWAQPGFEAGRRIRLFTVGTREDPQRGWGKKRGWEF